MDHGSHTFYLAFDWLGGHPTSITAKMATPDGFDTEDNLSCSMTFPNGGVASAHLSWTAGVRKVIYTIHGERGAIRVEDDDVEVAVMAQSRNKGDSGSRVTWEMKKEQVASEWMDAGHPVWFRSLFDDFARAVEKHDYAGREAKDSLRCVELIATAYASARDGSRELPLDGSPL
jgi:predicted dehydrogenase